MEKMARVGITSRMFTSVFVFVMVLAAFNIGGLHAEILPLSGHYYDVTCPRALSIIRKEMETAVLQDAALAAKVLRLHFHDCFVQGCDGSVLLDDTEMWRGEKTANANFHSLRGFEVIDAIKSAVESECPGVVSCADILTAAARDAVVLSGGPSWDVSLGRKDSTSTSFEEANNNLPSPNSGVQALATLFQSKGLSLTDMVTLIGGHTIGHARCVNIRPRIYNNTLAFKEPVVSFVKAVCPPGGDDDMIWPMDFPTPLSFDNSYYMNIIQGLGVLNSDQRLYSQGGETRALIESYGRDPVGFSKQFAQSMVKMSNIVDPFAFLSGEVRKNCRLVNRL